MEGQCTRARRTVKPEKKTLQVEESSPCNCGMHVILAPAPQKGRQGVDLAQQRPLGADGGLRALHHLFHHLLNLAPHVLGL